MTKRFITCHVRYTFNRVIFHCTLISGFGHLQINTCLFANYLINAADNTIGHSSVNQ